MTMIKLLAGLEEYMVGVTMPVKIDDDAITDIVFHENPTPKGNGEFSISFYYTVESPELRHIVSGHIVAHTGYGTADRRPPYKHKPKKKEVKMTAA
jgi:hypothetical protein